jgi:hypothetical protein
MVCHLRWSLYGLK